MPGGETAVRTYSDETVELKLLNRNLERIAIALEKQETRSEQFNAELVIYMKSFAGILALLGIPIGEVVQEQIVKGHES
jgi:hypothetical protein